MEKLQNRHLSHPGCLPHLFQTYQQHTDECLEQRNHMRYQHPVSRHMVPEHQMERDLLLADLLTCRRNTMPRRNTADRRYDTQGRPD